MRDCIGILGGMGPLATVDLMRKIIEATPAARDQDHVPVIAYSVPQVPDRLAAIASGDDAPWPWLLAGLRSLERAGAGMVAIACNTAHHWHARLQSETALPILHIADAACDDIATSCAPGSTIALLATPATVALRFYQERLHARGYAVAVPDASQQECVLEVIAKVKAGEVSGARALLEPVCEAMLAAGCHRLLLACTELPLALAESALDTVALDPTAALARSAVARSLAARNDKIRDGHQVVGGFPQPR
jgi:aspartate racemase